MTRKNMYSPIFFENLCPILQRNIPNFDCQYFIHLVFNNAWPEMELKQRVRHIARVLHNFLPSEFPIAAQWLLTLSVDVDKAGFSKPGFALMFIAEYVTLFGERHPKESRNAMELITKLQSFRDATLRRHHTGKQRVSILTNGRKLAEQEFIIY